MFAVLVAKYCQALRGAVCLWSEMLVWNMGVFKPLPSSGSEYVMGKWICLPELNFPDCTGSTAFLNTAPQRARQCFSHPQCTYSCFPPCLIPHIRSLLSVLVQSNTSVFQKGPGLFALQGRGCLVWAAGLWRISAFGVKMLNVKQSNTVWLSSGWAHLAWPGQHFLMCLLR